MRRMYSRIDGWTGMSRNRDRALSSDDEEKYRTDNFHCGGIDGAGNGAIASESVADESVDVLDF